MKTVKAVVFDYIGTLELVEDYSYQNSEGKLFECLLNSDFSLDYKCFIEASGKAHQKYRNIRF